MSEYRQTTTTTKRAVAIIYKLWYGLSQLCNSATLETVTGLYFSTPDNLSVKDPSAPKKKIAAIYGSIPCTRILTTVPFGSSSLRPQLYSLFYHWMWICMKKKMQLPTVISPLFFLTAIYTKLFPKSKLAKNPKPWHKTLILELVFLWGRTLLNTLKNISLQI